MKPEFQFIDSPDEKTLHDIMSLFEAGGWAESEPPDFYRRMIAGSVRFIVARAGGNAVGMARAIGDGVNDVYVQDVFVLPEYRRRGLAVGMINRLVAELRASGITWIALVASGPAGAQVYRKCGFEPMKDCKPMIFGHAVY